MPRAEAKTKSRTTREKAVPRARLEVDERRAQLLSLGIEVFSRSAYDEVSIDDVAREAGISKGLLYHYFANKREFYAETVREAARRLLVTTEIDETLPPFERLQRGLDAYLAYVVRHGRAYAALLRSGIGSDPMIARIVDETREAFLSRLLEGIHEPKPPLLVRAVMRGWVGFVEATSLEVALHPTLDRAVVRNLAIELLISALERAGRPT